MYIENNIGEVLTTNIENSFKKKTIENITVDNIMQDPFAEI